MSDLIIHHFNSSPFSEKVRLVLGFKKLAWRSVQVPVMLPKPDVVALTGGYRRTPFLQIGADIYCDTALMCRVIDRLHPQPPLYPTAISGLQHVVAQWADSALFWTAIPYTAQPAGIAQIFGSTDLEFLKALGADRAAMAGSMRRVTPIDAAAQLTSHLTWLDSLPEGSFLLGEQPCIADFSVAQSLWFMKLAPNLATVLTPYHKLTAWHDRVLAFGNGTRSELTSSDAIAIAAGTTAHAPAHVEAGLGFEAGAQVTACATDYAQDLIAGTLVGLSANEIVIERRDERAGTLHVHFPRIGYQLKKAN